MTLAEAIAARAEPGECLVVPFDAIKLGVRVLVTAVLRRTAVLQDNRPNERHLDLHAAFEEPRLACSWYQAARGTRARVCGKRAGSPSQWMGG